MSTLTPRQTQRRRSILKEVRDQLSSAGYDGLSMRDVAANAGVSPTTLYNLYESKDGLVLAALEDLLAELGVAIQATHTTGIERLVARARAIGRQITETPRYAEAMARMLFAAGPSDPITRILMSSAARDFEDLLFEMQRRKELRADVDVDRFVRLLLGNGWAIILLWLKGFIALHDLVDEYIRAHVLTIMPAMTPSAQKRYAAMAN